MTEADFLTSALITSGWIGGDGVGSFSRTETAYVHRTATTLLRPTTVWPNDADESVGTDLNDWSLAMIRTMKAHVLDEAYQNFANTMIDNGPQQYYAENYERLVDIKTKYDPGNIFHQSQSIPVRENA